MGRYISPDNFQFVDEDGIPYGVKHVENKPRVSSMPYLYDIAEGNVSDHEAVHVIGYNADVDAADETVWEVGGAYVPPSVAQQMEVYSSDDQDAGVVIKSGTSDSITILGSTITLTDAAVDFTAATAVVAGDFLILDGDVTAAIVVTVAANVITATVHDPDDFATSAQAYRIVDNSTGGTGIKALRVHYLDGDYSEQREFIVTNGTTVVTTTAVDILRVNNLDGKFAGTGRVAAGNIDIRHLTDTPIYRRILLGYDVAQCGFYTVPAGKTFYLVDWNICQGFSTVNRYIIARLRATCDRHGHWQEGLFHIKHVLMVQDGSTGKEFRLPLKVGGKSDVKVSAQCPDTNAVVTCGFEGWIE